MKLFRFLLVCTCLVGALCTLLGFFGKLDWRLDLLSHFRIQYAVFFIILLIVGFVAKSKILSIVALFFLILNLYPVIPFYFPSRLEVKDPGLVIMSANVSKENMEFESVAKLIQKVNPDIFLLEEVNAEWLETMSSLNTNYKYKIAEAREDYSGILLFSKYPLRNQRIENFGQANPPTIVADIQLNDKWITIIGAHPVPPISRKFTEQRNNQFEELGSFINRLTLPVLLLGDMNTTPFAYPYKQLLKDTKLTNCANGFGYHATWRFNHFVPPFGLFIDHCFYTKPIVVQEIYIGPDINSDHGPLIMKVSLN